jgi:hypothetical protein
LTRSSYRNTKIFDSYKITVAVIVKSTVLRFHTFDNYSSGIRQSESNHFMLNNSEERRSSAAARNSLEEQISFLSSLEEPKMDPLFVHDPNSTRSRSLPWEDSTRTRTAQVDMFLTQVAHGESTKNFEEYSLHDDVPEFVSAPVVTSHKAEKVAMDTEKTEATKETESSREFSSDATFLPTQSMRWQVPNADDALHDNLASDIYQQDFPVKPVDLNIQYIETMPSDDVYISHAVTAPESELPEVEVRKYKRSVGVDRGDTTKPDEEANLDRRSANYNFKTEEGIISDENEYNESSDDGTDHTSSFGNDWKMYGFKSQEQAKSVLSFLSTLTPDERYNLLAKLGKG